MITEAGERLARVRRRGKDLVRAPYIATTNEHNELFRVQVERRTPFRGSTSDVAQAGVRCNFDFQFMPRAAQLIDQEIAEESSSSAVKPEPDNESKGRERDPASKRSLTYDRADAFYGVRLRLPDDVVMRRAAHSMLAMWQAAHNADYYITKYGTKALEQLQNLIGQFAQGLRRLEIEEEQERSATEPAALENPQTYKQRARKITLKLAMAANRRGHLAANKRSLFVQEPIAARPTIPEKLTSAGSST